MYFLVSHLYEIFHFCIQYKRKDRINCASLTQVLSIALPVTPAPGAVGGRRAQGVPVHVVQGLAQLVHVARDLVFRQRESSPCAARKGPGTVTNGT